MLVLDLQWLLFVLLCAALLVLGALAFALRKPSTASTSTLSLLSLLDLAPVGTLILAGGEVSYANRVAREILHLTSGAGGVLPSADWSEVLYGDIVGARRQDPSGSGRDGRFRTVTFASDRTVRWWVCPQGEEDLVLLWDVTGEERVQRAGRVLISDLGHELRTPIATLLTHLEILGLDDTPAAQSVGDGVRHQSLQIAKREAQRMSRLVNDMLELGRLESAETLDRRPLNLVSLAEEVVLQTMPRARELTISLDLVAGSGLPPVVGNGDRLRQVLLNLLDNALKYAGRSARVTVSLERGERGIVCAVCDTGPGIAPEHLPRAGQRFYRAAPEMIEGSGLGLSVVREVLRLHRSELALTSPVDEGRGTCARFELPIAEEEVAA
jgi:two-component system, OmpR family, phosphate regulon sensor histidine kinase PhoR